MGDEMKKCVSKEFLELCDKKYPAMIDNRAFRRMFMYLAFGTYQDFYHENEDQIATALVLSYKKLCYIVEKPQELHLRNFRAEKFLKEFQQKVLPGFTWNEAEAPDPNSYDYGKCRTVKTTGFDQETLDAIQREMTFDGQKYYFDSGKKLNGVTRAADRKSELEAYMDDAKVFNLNPTQQKILDGLEKVSMNGRAFTQKLEENMPHILAAIDNLQAKADDVLPLEEKKNQQRKILESIKEDGRVFYRPTPLARTPRLHATNECVLSLKSSVRKAFCKGWIEADLLSSQFIILASLLDAPIATAFINSMETTGWNLWTYLNEAAGGTGKPVGAEKEPLKELIYGICFGMSKKTVKGKLEKAGKACLMKNPLVAELLERRAAWFDAIKAHGYVTDVWGNKHYLEKGGRKTDIYGNKIVAKERWEGSLAATKIQSIEMEIISAIFDCQDRYAPRYKFSITAFQHDGFTMSCTDKNNIEVVQARLNKYVREKAEEVGKKLGINLSAVKLEFNQL